MEAWKTQMSAGAWSERPGLPVKKNVEPEDKNQSRESIETRGAIDRRSERVL
jgi:hypothetical protein